MRAMSLFVVAVLAVVVGGSLAAAQSPRARWRSISAMETSGATENARPLQRAGCVEDTGLPR